MKHIKGLSVLLAVLVGLYGVNQAMLASESKKIVSYGRKIQVLGGKMNIVEKGSENRQTLVFLPGYGTPAPGLDFGPLMDELARDYHVVAIEPFGYGDSDGTNRPRTIDNITEEVHLAIEELGLEDYILCGHSISGIYSIYYLNRYPHEARGFIGLDTSVPKQLDHKPNRFSYRLRKTARELGWIRLASWVYPQAFRGTKANYTHEVQTQTSYRVNRDFANDTNLDEANHFESNWRKVEHLTYPMDMKKVFFLSKQEGEDQDWRSLETQNAFRNHRGKIYLLDGGHYIHRDQVEEIGRLIRKEWKYQ